MIRRARKLEAARARIAELEADLGLVERPRESDAQRWERQIREERERRRKRDSDEARLFAGVLLYVVGVVAWTMLAFMGAAGSGRAAWHRHHWLLWATGAWDLPAAVALAIGSITFIGWLATGRNLLGRWL